MLFLQKKGIKQNFRHYQYDDKYLKNIYIEYINTGWGTFPRIYSFEYNNKGRLESITSTSSKNSKQDVYTFNYQLKNNNLHRIIEKYSPTVEIVYDSDWKKLSYTDSEQHSKSVYQYDKRDKLLRTDFFYN